MKCPACNYVCSDLRDLCPECHLDLRPQKKILNIKVVSPSATYEELLGKVKKSSKKKKPASTASTNDEKTDLFSFFKKLSNFTKALVPVPETRPEPEQNAASRSSPVSLPKEETIAAPPVSAPPEPKETPKLPESPVPPVLDFSALDEKLDEILEDFAIESEIKVEAVKEKNVEKSTEFELEFVTDHLTPSEPVVVEAEKTSETKVFSYDDVINSVSTPSPQTTTHPTEEEISMVTTEVELPETSESSPVEELTEEREEEVKEEVAPTSFEARDEEPTPPPPVESSSPHDQEFIVESAPDNSAPLDETTPSSSTEPPLEEVAIPVATLHYEEPSPAAPEVKFEFEFDPTPPHTVSVLAQEPLPEPSPPQAEIEVNEPPSEEPLPEETAPTDSLPIVHASEEELEHTQEQVVTKEELLTVPPPPQPEPSVPSYVEAQAIGLRGKLEIVQYFEEALAIIDSAKVGALELSWTELAPFKKDEQTVLLFDLAAEAIDNPEGIKRFTNDVDISIKRKVTAGELDNQLAKVEKAIENQTFSLKLGSTIKTTKESQAETVTLPSASYRERRASFISDCVPMGVMSALITLIVSARTESELWLNLIALTPEKIPALSLIVPSTLFIATFLIISMAYPLLFLLWRGSTLGMASQNIRVLSISGKPPKSGQIMVRALSLPLSALSLGFLPLRSGQAAKHDILSNTMVVRCSDLKEATELE